MCKHLREKLRARAEYMWKKNGHAACGQQGREMKILEERGRGEKGRAESSHSA